MNKARYNESGKCQNIGSVKATMFQIEDLQKYNDPKHIYVTQHGRRRLWERGIHIEDVMSVIAGGEIIEEYPDDYPFPSCLMLGMDVNGCYLHIVISLAETIINLITAYYPDADEWEAGFRMRKR